MQIKCEIVRVLFRNAKNGYAAVLCKNAEGETLIANGKTLAALDCKMNVVLEGEWTTHAKYGKQFSVRSWKHDDPTDEDGIMKYLSSGFFTGIGKKTAKLIVKEFGEKTLDILDNEPEKLLAVKGITERKLTKIKTAWDEQRGLRKVMLFLKSHDVSNAMAYRIHNAYGTDCIRILQENPYRLADEVNGIGFKSADKIAADMGIGHDAPERIQAGLRYILTDTCEHNGAVFVKKDDLVSKSAELLEVSTETVDAQTAALDGDDLVWRDDRIYPAMYFYAEKGIAHRLSRMPENTDPISIEFMDLQARCGVLYSSEQKVAIRTAVNNMFCVMTGGPGTGKTTTTNGIIRALQQSGRTVLLAAPTGRAAKRMTEATGCQAKTIHRLLEFNFTEGFVRNEDNPLEGDALVVDEASMIDILLMNNLLKAVPEHMQVILVGDIDQLPSVGCGNCLHDIIASEAVPVIRLTQIFRQAQDSDIIKNAHLINKGQFPRLKTEPGSDFMFVETEGAEQTGQYIVDEYVRFIRSGGSMKSIQVLTPRKQGACGVEYLNRTIRDILNPASDDKRELTIGGRTFRIGDKVMQMSNNYQKDVFNGDIGYVIDVDEEDCMLTIEFNGNVATFSKKESDSLELAYVSTIHKSQGSEFPNVIIAMTTAHYVGLQRNLLYTAVTRAKKSCLVVGETKAIALCVNNNALELRDSTLIEQIRDYNF